MWGQLLYMLMIYTTLTLHLYFQVNELQIKQTTQSYFSEDDLYVVIITVRLYNKYNQGTTRDS